jgi:hypothetical protein
MTAYAHSGDDAELLPLATQPVNPLQTTQCPANRISKKVPPLC